jgi:hypothetical protein
MTIAFVGATFGLGVPFMAISSLPLVGFLWLLYSARRQEIGAALAMAALDRAARGRFDEARALLNAISPKVLSSYVGQMVDSQRAALALYEGRLEEAVAEATKGAREGRRLRILGRIHRGSALSIRAVALAGLGRKEEALRDISSVRAATLRHGAFTARVAVAEALIFARDKDLDALARLLREERSLLLGATGPRERMVVRALARLVAAKKISVYREPAKREEQDFDENASWVARMAPDAASYAHAPKLGAQLEAPPVVDAKAVARAEKSAPKAKRPFKRLAALWAVLVAMFLAIWQFLQPAANPVEAPSAAAGGGVGLLFAMVIGVFAIVVGILAFRIVRANKLTVALGEAIELRQRGKTAEAKEALSRLATSKVPLVPPQAERELATIASAEGDFKAATRHAEAGIVATRTSNVALALSRAVLLPQLIGELAFSFAARGNDKLAEEELTKLQEQFPAYPYLAKDTFRVRLVALAAKERFREAAAMARERPADLPLSMQEELLCDALRVQQGDTLPEGERERIELELRDDVGPARFVDGVAPTLRSRVGERLRGPRVADGVGEDQRETTDEVENDEHEQEHKHEGRKIAVDR